MQAYKKADETGWDVYDACVDSGAMIAMGHAHTYSRTYLMKDFRNQEVAHRSSEMTLEPGRSFAVVSGLGGRDVKSQQNNEDWFASVYTQSQGATHGALYCTLEQSTAKCYFKAINGAVPDQFTLILGAGSSNSAPEPVTPVQDSPPQSSNPTEPAVSGVFRRTDKDEYRWITRDNSGQWSSSWISETCASTLGGARYSGNWNDLIAIAPHINTNYGPCDGSSTQLPPQPSSEPNGSGFVFSRTDKSGFRWVDGSTSGLAGNIWIDAECARHVGWGNCAG